MDVLIDTHALLWTLEDPSKLSGRALAVLENSENVVLVSAAVAWEMAIKTGLGKLQSLDVIVNLGRHLADLGFTELPVSIEQATRVALLPLHHRDPFDRLLVAQAQSLGAPIVSADATLEQYDIKRLW